MKFSGKNVLVTGSSRGIGAEIAKTLASYGLKVWVNYRSGKEAADSVKDEIIKNGGEAEGVERVDNGGLNNIAPTVLKLMDLEIPSEMDHSLV